MNAPRAALGTAALASLALSACGGEQDPHLRAGDGPRSLHIAGAQLELVLGDGALDLPRSGIETWVRNAAQAVASYYGRFPVQQVRIQLHCEDGSGVGNGETRLVEGTPLIQITVGSHSTMPDLEQDWVLPHEMTHLGIPNLPRQHHWFEEGVATYVEPIARAQLGQIPVEEVWRQLVEGLPQGQPGPRDRGLDRTHTWGRTYWGGALFCLLAEVGIRERTGNRLGLQDALRGPVASGRTMMGSAGMQELMSWYDQAVGVPVLSELYAQHATAAVRVDLDRLWQRLGVSLADGAVRFDDSAELAAIRSAITAAER